MKFKLDSAPDVILAIKEDQVHELDVRPILRSGGEPFSVIMEAVAKLGKQDALRLRATFEPIPLFRVLRGRGLEHWIELGEGDDWIVWFYSPNQPKALHPEEDLDLKVKDLFSKFPEISSRLKINRDDWTLDVRGLSPPIPMELTLATMGKLPRDGKIIQINDRLPQFLLPLLEERGFSYDVLEEGPEATRVAIYHAIELL